MSGTNPDAGLDRTGGAGDGRGRSVDDWDGGYSLDPTAPDIPTSIIFSLGHTHDDRPPHLHTFAVYLRESVTIAILDPHAPDPDNGRDHPAPGDAADPDHRGRDAEADGSADGPRSRLDLPRKVLREEVTKAVRSSDV
jgi:hypothetical protein